MRIIKYLYLCLQHVFWYLIYLVKYFEYQLWVLFLLTHVGVLIAIFLGQTDRFKWLRRFGKYAKDQSEKFADSLSNSRFFGTRLKKLLINLAKYVSASGLLGKTGEKMEKQINNLKEGAIEAIGLSIVGTTIYNILFGSVILFTTIKVIKYLISQF